jgi:4-hydroxyphenylacetate 3-monooxygenase
VDATVVAGEERCEIDRWGVAAPGRPELYANMVLQSQIAPDVAACAREIMGERMLLGSGAFGGQPGTADLADKVRQLAWDLVGSEFGGRQHQYELFYAGAPFVVRRHMARHYDEAGARGLATSVLKA